MRTSHLASNTHPVCRLKWILATLGILDFSVCTASWLILRSWYISLVYKADGQVRLNLPLLHGTERLTVAQLVKNKFTSLLWNPAVHYRVTRPALAHILSQIIPDYILKHYFSKSILILSFSCVCDATAKVGPRPPYFWSFLITHTHTHTHTHPFGLPWTNEQPVAEAATCTTHKKYKSRTSMPSAGFEPTTPVIDRPQIYALDSTATGIGFCIRLS